MIATDPITRALAYTGGTHGPEDIDGGVREGRFQRWDGEDSSIVTEILQSPRRKTLHFFLAAGNMTELRGMVPPIMEWGKQQGCTKASFIGRLGWMRSFVREFGFRSTGLLMEADL